MLSKALVGLLLLVTITPAQADEVDDILNLRAKNRDRVKKFSAEFLMETKQPKSVKNPKTLRMRYRMKLERLPKEAKAPEHNPWLVEAEVLEPLPMKLKIKGDQAWFMDQHGNWVELPMTPELREQFLGMSERMMGTSPENIRRHADIRILRRNNPFFGAGTRTLEVVPRGKAKVFQRMEEDVNDAGLPMVTRIYDEKEKVTVSLSVKKHRVIKGVSVAEEIESLSVTPGGEIVSATICSNIELDTTDLP